MFYSFILGNLLHLLKNSKKGYKQVKIYDTISMMARGALVKVKKFFRKIQNIF